MKNLKSLYLAFVCVASLATTAVAQDGSLDASFGTGGKLTTTFGMAATAYATALQPDGKILVTGTTFDGDDVRNFATIRYLSSGAIDSTFGTNGKVETDFFGGRDIAYAVAVQSDGMIVVAGQGGSGLSFVVARYNADGSLDNTFASGGLLILASTGGNAINSLAIQPDGKILAAGSSFNANRDFSVVRLNTNGSLDSTFGSGGTANVDFRQFDIARKVILLPRGKILLVGDVSTGNLDFGLARLNRNGTLDSSFGTGGKVITDIPSPTASLSSDAPYDAVVSTMGKITVAGSANNAFTVRFAVVRYNANGDIDNTFGTGGIITTSIGGFVDVARALVAQGDGKVVAIGYSSINGFNDIALARYNKNGNLDNTFGTGGKVTTDFGGTNVSDFAYAGLLQPDGKIVALGTSPVNNMNNFAAVRYNNSITAAPQAELTESSVETQSPLEIGTPQAFELGSNYPNPFNPSTVINYQLSVNSQVQLKVYDMLGREVATLVNAKQAAGSYSVNFNAVGLSSGVYLYKLQAGSFSATKKMLLVK